MSELQRNHARLHYDVSGVGPPVLLTHGFAATSRIWRDQSVALGSRNTIIAWDMRGHGRSRVGGGEESIQVKDSIEVKDSIQVEDSIEVEDSIHSKLGTTADERLFNVDETLDDMAAILDHLGHERAVIGGHSLGGYMALAFYQKYPERVRALLILATGPGYRNDAAREEWNTMAKGLAHRIEKHGLEVLRNLDRNMDPGEHESARELGMAARGMLVQRNGQIIDSLSEIRIPTLVVVGEKDRGYLASSKYMVEKIPNAEFVSIPNAGHAVNLHQPELFNRAAQSFLDRIE